MARTPSNADILLWTEESLRNSHLDRRLKPLFEALGLQHLDRDDPARGDRRGKSYAKADYVRALLAHQQAVRDAGATSPAFSANDFVQFRSDAGTWQLAYVAAVRDLGGSPIYTLRQPGGADIRLPMPPRLPRPSSAAAAAGLTCRCRVPAGPRLRCVCTRGRR